MSIDVLTETHGVLAQTLNTEAPDSGQRIGETTSVSVVIPCFNEERLIEKVLANLIEQYHDDAYEVLVVDGGSTDGTRAAVDRFVEAHPSFCVQVIDNPARHIPVGVNLGIARARGQVIVRMDAHSTPSPNYVRRCVELLVETEASVVGMTLRVRAGADTLTARAIAIAVAHPFGIGDAKYRSAGLSGRQFVDTVPFGAFRKTLWQELGGFSENLLTNEDYDFNYRVRSRGGQVLLDTKAYCQYFARPTLRELSRQYFRYGYWKARMVQLHPRSIKLRQIVAPAFVTSLVASGALSLAWSPMVWVLLAIIIAYSSLALFYAAQLARRNGAFKLLFPLFLSFTVIHLCWGTGFILGLVPRRASRSEAR
jgi:glycosyltransferase involved in cell wall biosynthesis